MVRLSIAAGGKTVALPALLMLLAVGPGCSGTPPPPDTVVDLSLVATSDLNPDAQGRPSPALVRIYELTSEDPFRTATYYDLRDAPEDTLGPTVVSRREIVVNPGTATQRTFEVEDNARIIGLVVDYQDLENAIWRSYISVRTGEENRLHTSLRADEVTLILTRPQERKTWWDTLMPF
jgi:type VI secretion system protein VasD